MEAATSLASSLRHLTTYWRRWTGYAQWRQRSVEVSKSSSQQMEGTSHCRTRAFPSQGVSRAGGSEQPTLVSVNEGRDVAEQGCWGVLTGPADVQLAQYQVTCHLSFRCVLLPGVSARHRQPNWQRHERVSCGIGYCYLQIIQPRSSNPRP